MKKSQQYAMTLSLNVLEHLGINLYSNVPAVLSEAVANAWDADAENVEITIDQTNGRIVIKDDGIGMTHAEVNERFLKVGYRRRDVAPGKTPKGRSPMGRKGIGKLSLFSIADLVEVHTTKNRERSAFRMHLPTIREKIQDGDGTYYPEAIEASNIDIQEGTEIILTELSRRQTIRTPQALRKRLARRFSIIGKKEKFQVSVNDEAIEPSDRDYYEKIQYLWTYGQQTEVTKLCKNKSRHEKRDAVLKSSSVSMSGWLGTVKQSSDLKDEESGDNLNRIAIFIRGKMAQEDILDGFGEKGVYASYLIGELRVDTLDEDDKQDAATSSRQHLVEDDERYVKLQEIIGTELKYIQSCWSDWRTEDGAEKAMEIPAVKGWIEELPKDYKKKARQWIGKINKITTDDSADEKKLIKHAILAFEFYRANQGIQRLEKIDDENLETVLAMFEELDGLEASLYGQIVQQRLSVIRTLQDKVDENELEKVIQRYIFEHLWLLDPHWERVEATERMEKRVGKLFETVNAGLTKEEKDARIDIGYRKTAGKHVIVELKRPNVKMSVHDLSKQIGKYRSGLEKILEDIGTSNEPIEFILLLGKPPLEWTQRNGKQLVEDTLSVQHARFVLYDELLENAFRAYSDYTKKRKTVDKLQEVIKAIDDYVQ